MSFTDTEALRIQAIESAINTLQTASNNLATRKEMKNLFAILDQLIRQIRTDLEQLEMTASGSALANHIANPDPHPNLEIVADHGGLTGLADDDHTQYLNTTRGDARYFREDEFVATSAGVADAGKPVILSASGVLDSTLLPGSAGNDHGALGGLGDDDHPQYHNDARAYTWLATRSTTDLPEGTNQYFTDARVTANATVQSGVLHVHDRSHEVDSIADHLPASSVNYGKYLRANPSTGILEFSAISLDDASIPDDLTLTNITQITNRSHTNLTDIGTNTHAQIDTALATAASHIADSTVHFTDPYTPADGTLNIVGKLSVRASGGGSGSEQFGEAAIATGANSTAVGANASTGSLTSATAIGASALVQSNNGIAIGTSAINGGADAIAIGVSASANGSEAIAIGKDTIANNTGATAVGDGSLASGSSAVAFGKGATASAGNSVAIGPSASAAGTSSIAIGSAASVPSTVISSIAIGLNASTTGAGSTGNRSIALGQISFASQDDVIAIGYDSGSASANTIAIGGQINNSGSRSIVIGKGGILQAANALYINTGSTPRTVTGGSSILIGGFAGNNSNSSSVHIGAGQTVGTSTGYTNVVSIGEGITIQASSSTAVGRGTACTATNTVAVGVSAQATSSGAIAVGRSATAATGAGAIAIGETAASQSASGIAIGNTAAIGTGSSNGTAILIGTSTSISNSVSNVIAMGPSSIIGAGSTIYLNVGTGRTISGANNVILGSIAGTSTNTKQVVLGTSATVGTSAAYDSIVGVGYGVTLGASNTVAVGASTTASGDGSIAIGKSATTSTFTNALAIGTSAAATANNEAQLGTSGQPYNIITYGTLTTKNSLRHMGYTSSTADPSTTELPNDKDWSIHKNTSSADVFLAYNDGGVIKKVLLT